MSKRTFNHGDYETRRRKAIERLGREDGKCPFCGEDDPFCLHDHHVAGQEFDDTTVILCLNHHAKITNAHKRPSAEDRELHRSKRGIRSHRLGCHRAALANHRHAPEGRGPPS